VRLEIRKKGKPLFALRVHEKGREKYEKEQKRTKERNPGTQGGELRGERFFRLGSKKPAILGQGKREDDKFVDAL